MTYQPPKPFSIVEFWPLGRKGATFWRVDGGGFAHPAHSIKGDAEAERDALNALFATHCEAAYREGRGAFEEPTLLALVAAARAVNCLDGDGTVEDFKKQCGELVLAASRFNATCDALAFHASTLPSPKEPKT